MKSSTRFIIALLLPLFSQSQITWYSSNTGLAIGVEPFKMTMAPDGKVFVVCRQQFTGSTNTKILSSLNRGLSWSDVNATGLTNMTPISLLSKDNSLFMTAQVTGSMSNSLYRSNDNGVTWSIVNTGLPSNYVLMQLASDGAGKILMTGTKPVSQSTSGTFFAYSSDDGVSWTEVQSSILAQLPNPKALGFAGGKILLAAHNSQFSNVFYFSSSDNGTTWVQGGNGIMFNFQARDFTAAGTGTIYLVGSDISSSNPVARLYASTDNTATWNEVLMSGQTVNGGVMTILQTQGPLLTGGITLSSAAPTMINHFIYSSDLTTGIASHQETSFSAYPVPNNGLLYLKTGNPASAFGSVRLLSATGAVVLASETVPDMIDMHDCAPGLYTLLISYDGKTEKLKFTRE